MTNKINNYTKLSQLCNEIAKFYSQDVGMGYVPENWNELSDLQLQELETQASALTPEEWKIVVEYPTCEEYCTVRDKYESLINNLDKILF